MRWLPLLLLGALSSCDCNARLSVTSVPSDAAPAASSPGAPAIVIPSREVVSKRRSRRVLIVGDSEACAVAPYAQQVANEVDDRNGWPRDDVHVSCKGGTVVSYWGAYGHFYQALQEYPHPDHILIFLGTNHYWQKQAPDLSVMKSELENLRIAEAGFGPQGFAPRHEVGCTWVGNTAVRGHTWAINGLLREAVKPDCDYFDTEAADIPLYDGVHPGREGAVKWLRLVWDEIPARYEEADQ